MVWIHLGTRGVNLWFLRSRRNPCGRFGSYAMVHPLLYGAGCHGTESVVGGLVGRRLRQLKLLNDIPRVWATTIFPGFWNWVV